MLICLCIYVYLHTTMGVLNDYNRGHMACKANIFGPSQKKKKKKLILAKKYIENILCLSLGLGVDQERFSLSHQAEEKSVGHQSLILKWRSNYSYMPLHNGKCVVRQFYCANIRECIYTNLDSIANYCNCMCYTLIWLAMQVCLHHKHMSNALC